MAPLVPQVSTALLLPQDRIARRPLGAWAESLSMGLRERLHSIRETRELARRVGAIANNAALIGAHYGQMDTAWALCSGQMRWQLRLARRSGDRAVAALAVQPWVNLGRLDALVGRCESALARFAALQEFRTAGVMRLGSACVDGSGWATVSDTPDAFADFISAVHVIDSLKALLLAGRFDEVLAFRKPDDLSPLIAALAAEARAVSLARLGKLAFARSAAREAAQTEAAWNRAVFRLRVAEIEACGGNTEFARDALRSLSGLLHALSPTRREELQTLHVTARVATACREVGLDREACAAARDVYDGANAAHDEVFRIESLRLLAEAAPADERGRWAGMLAEAEETTEYRRFRRGGEVPPNPVIEELFARLQDLFTS